MSSRDGNESMEHDFGWSHAAFEAALRGSPDAPADLSALVAATIIDLTDPINDDLAKHHIATSAAVARSVAHAAAQAAQIELAARAAREVHEERTTVPARHRRRMRRLTFAGAFSGMWAKIALGTAALAAVGTGAAVTDSLPDAVQAVVSDVAGVVGVELPHPDEPKTVGPADPASLPGDNGVSDEGRTRAQDLEIYRACVATAEAGGLDADEECTKPAPPGQDDDFVAPGQDPTFVAPGQDPNFVPPGQDSESQPPGQEDKDTPPGQEDKDTPPGQDDDHTPPGQDDKDPPPGRNNRP